MYSNLCLYWIYKQVSRDQSYFPCSVTSLPHGTFLCKPKLSFSLSPPPPGWIIILTWHCSVRVSSPSPGGEYEYLYGTVQWGSSPIPRVNTNTYMALTLRPPTPPTIWGEYLHGTVRWGSATPLSLPHTSPPCTRSLDSPHLRKGTPRTGSLSAGWCPRRRVAQAPVRAHLYSETFNSKYLYITFTISKKNYSLYIS